MTSTIGIEPDRLQQIRRLTEVSRALTYATSLDEVFQLTVDRAADLLAAEQALLLIVDEEGLLTSRSSHGVDPTLTARFRAPLNEDLVPRLTGFLGAHPESFLGVPLVVAGKIKGILVVIRPSIPLVPVERDEWLLSALADQAAIALEKTRLDQMAEFREQLIGIVGHDLRNPLNTILMGAQILVLRQGLGEMETDVVRKITTSAKQAVRLIDQLLDLTRSRLGGGIPIDRKRFDLGDVCRQVIDENELTHPDRPLGVQVRGDLTGAWDRDRLYQLLANIVGNAIQHGEPRSPIQLRIDGGGTEVLIEVVNRGAPIPPEAMPFLFEAFRRGRTLRPSQTEGLGLGLFIAEQIVRAHHGSIAVSSSEREGTTVRVRLPRSAVAAP